MGDRPGPAAETAFARVMWDTGAVVMPDGRSLEMLIQSNRIIKVAAIIKSHRVPLKFATFKEFIDM